MERMAFGPPGFTPDLWDPLSRAVASARALSPDSPYHRARSLLVGPCALGAYDAPIGFDGSWSARSSSILKRVDPRLMTLAVPKVALEAETILLRAASEPFPGEASAPSGASRRL